MDKNLKLATNYLEPMILAYSRINPAFFLKVKQYLDTSSLKGKSYFNDEKYQRIFNLISKFYDKKRVFPKQNTIKAIVDKIERDEEIKLLLFSIIDTMYKTDSIEIDNDYIEEEVKNFISEAQLYEAILESQIDIAERNFSKVSERVEKAIRVNFDKDLGLSINNIDEAMSRIKKHDDEDCIDTGYPHLNRLLDGGFHPKEIYCIAAVPGGGKTMMLGNFALNMYLQGKNVLVYTFETSTERLMMRYFANLTGMNKKEILNSENTLKERFDNMQQVTTPGELILKEYNSNEVSSNDLMAHIVDLEMYLGFKPDVILSDYLLIMKTNDGSLSSDNSYKYYKTVTEELRNIGKSLSVPIVTACQINREGMGDKGGSKAHVTAKDVSESRGIYDTVDVFWTIAQTSNDYKNNRLYFYFDKNRNDKTGVKIEFKVNYEHMKMTEESIIGE
jgi:replicative DNA helicase